MHHSRSVAEHVLLSRQSVADLAPTEFHFCTLISWYFKTKTAFHTTIQLGWSTCNALVQDQMIRRYAHTTYALRMHSASTQWLNPTRHTVPHADPHTPTHRTMYIPSSWCCAIPTSSPLATTGAQSLVEFVTLRHGFGTIVYSRGCFAEYIDSVLHKSTRNRGNYCRWPRRIKAAFYEQVVSRNILEGARLLMHITSIGRLRTNTVVLGWKISWIKELVAKYEAAAAGAGGAGQGLLDGAVDER